MYNWIKAGCPRDRLIVGIPGYGRAFSSTGDDPLKSYGQAGGASSISSPYLGETGLLAYYEVRDRLVTLTFVDISSQICRKELKEGFKRFWHGQHQIPISFKDGTWIGYDDPESVRNKVGERHKRRRRDPIEPLCKCQYVKREGFAGTMIWSLDMDDFTGKFCRKSRKKRLQRFPLVMAMKEEFERDESTTLSDTTDAVSPTNNNNNTPSNETILLNDDFKAILNQMFEEASSSTPLFFGSFVHVLTIVSSLIPHL